MVLSGKPITYVMLLGFWMLAGISLFAQAPSNRLVSPTTAKQYKYLYNYKKNSSNCIIIGQNLGHRNQIIDFYESYVQRLRNESGKAPGIIGGDLGLEDDLDPDAVGQILQSYTQSGGMVTLSWQCINPWSGTFYADRNKYRSLKRLMQEGDTLHDIWVAELDEVATILQNFQERDVPILWRPFSDMNGDWYWWGANAQRDPQEFKDLWKFTYNYLTHEKGLNNLLWVFSVNQSTILTDDPGLWLKGEAYYPGGDYVDIVGMTLFDDNLELKDYHDFLNLKQFNKPLALTLCGPTQETADGNYDYLHFLKKINEHFPEIVYANVMHSYDDRKLALTDNKNYVELLNQSCVVDQGDINLEIEWKDDKESLLDNISIFPQPIDDNFFISAPNIIDGPITITLRNMVGLVTYEKVVDQIYFLQVDLPQTICKGTYALEITTAESRFVQKLIVQ